MEKKTIFLELPCEIIDKIDTQNTFGDRSIFVSDLLEKQLQREVSRMTISSEIMTRMDTEHVERASGEIGLVDDKGMSLGKFNINTVEGFENLAKKISDFSDDPIVRMRVRRWR